MTNGIHIVAVAEQVSDYLLLLLGFLWRSFAVFSRDLTATLVKILVTQCLKCLSRSIGIIAALAQILPDAAQAPALGQTALGLAACIAVLVQISLCANQLDRTLCRLGIKAALT